MESFCAGNITNAANEVANTLPDNVSTSAKSLFSVLLQLSLDVIEDSGLRSLPTFVTFHSSLEVACAVAGISRMSGFRACRELKALGVLDSRPFKATYRGLVRNSGTLFCLKLNPGAGSKARLTYAEFKQPWKVSWTSYRTLLQTQKTSTKELKYLLLKQYTVNPFTDISPGEVSVTSDSPLAPDNFNFFGGARLESVLDVVNAPKESINRVVDLAAEALCNALRDSTGRNYYRMLLWQLVRRFKTTGEDYSRNVYMMALRARTDALEGFSRRGGAVLVSRLKEAEWYQYLLDAPKIRVGIAPPS